LKIIKSNFIVTQEATDTLPIKNLKDIHDMTNFSLWEQKILICIIGYAMQDVQSIIMMRRLDVSPNGIPIIGRERPKR
jgi:hypothetical protein